MADMTINNDRIYLDPYEDVTREDVIKAMRMGFTTLTEVKNFTRAGMGVDAGRQGRYLIAEELAGYHNLQIEEVMKPSYRPPLEPVNIGAIADAYESEIEDAVREGVRSV